MGKNCLEPNLFIDFKKTQLAAGGKPSTWLPPGGLVEHILLFKSNTGSERG